MVIVDLCRSPFILFFSPLSVISFLTEKLPFRLGIMFPAAYYRSCLLTSAYFEFLLFLSPGSVCTQSQFSPTKLKNLIGHELRHSPQTGDDPIKLFAASIDATLEFQPIIASLADCLIFKHWFKSS